MQRSLLLKLLGAFALVILVSAAIVSFLANRAAAGEFRLYTTRSGQLWAQRLAPLVADHYTRTGSWDGVAAVLQSSLGMGTMMGQPGGATSSMMGGNMMRPGMMRGMMGQDWSQEGVESRGWDMWTMMGQRLILTDDQGHVVADTMGELTGQKLPWPEVAGSVPITVPNSVWPSIRSANAVDDRQVGTLIVTSMDAVSATTPAGQFLDDVNRSILLAALVAGVIALGLGSFLFFQLTAPIRQMMVAARGIAAGDLSQRVPIRSRDELGELAQTFNIMAENLAQFEEQRRHMVADIAHELRTPLTIIQGNLEAMLDGVLPLEAEQVALVHEETLLLGRLVADLRLLSLAEAGQLKLERAETDLGELIRKVVGRMRSPAKEKHVTVQTDLPATLPILFLDADRITQVIGNLVSNALRYTPAGGQVTVQAFVETTLDHRPFDADSVAPRRNRPQDRQRSAVVRSAAAVGGPFDPAKDSALVVGRSSVVVEVIDTGSGIAPEDLPHAFDRFYRADKSRSRTSGGSGIGLAIVKQLVEAHGGQVWAESPVFSRSGESDYGTRVSFTLPIAKELPLKANFDNY